LFAPIIVYFWFSEKTAPHFKYAAGVGFIGVALILKPDVASSWLSIDAGIGLLSGLLAALALSTVRRMAESESTLTVVFYFTVISTVMSATVVVWHWQPLSVMQGIGLFCVGLFATLGQLAMTRGYHLAEVGKIGPFMYSAVVFAFCYGWIFWQELPDLFAVVGILFVVVGGVMALYDPRRWLRGKSRA
jgi:drug/metabolite transporter (DMT)-like permease